MFAFLFKFNVLEEAGLNALGLLMFGRGDLVYLGAIGVPKIDLQWDCAPNGC